MKTTQAEACATEKHSIVWRMERDWLHGDWEILGRSPG
jgi:hypothetical protein